MPELPEVETIKRGLTRELLGAKISGIEVLNEKSMPDANTEAAQELLDTKITGLRRRGKVLVVDLSSGYSLLIHLKMTGQLIYEKPDGMRRGGGHPTKSMVGQLPDRSTRVVFEFRDGGRLFFNDQRKFGWIKLLTTSKIEENSLLMRMGQEPLSDTFTPDELRAKIGHRSAPVKAALLDQSNVAGLGNIYVDESLHLAKIHPLTKASALNVDNITMLHTAIKTIITSAIVHEGTTFSDYRNHWGEHGNYFNHARVFGREGAPCVECGTTIEKIRVAGRGTHVCPQCQVIEGVSPNT